MAKLTNYKSMSVFVKIKLFNCVGILVYSSVSNSITDTILKINLISMTDYNTNISV